MPYLEAGPLRNRLSRENELPVTEAVKILCEVVDALAAAHRMGAGRLAIDGQRSQGPLALEIVPPPAGSSRACRRTPLDSMLPAAEPARQCPGVAWAAPHYLVIALGLAPAPPCRCRLETPTLDAVCTSPTTPASLRRCRSRFCATEPPLGASGGEAPRRHRQYRLHRGVGDEGAVVWAAGSPCAPIGR